jgi:hypothetical protein
MALTPGTDVDYCKPKLKQDGRWHGVVVGQGEDGVEVLWLMSEETSDYFELADKKVKVRYHRGYTTKQPATWVTACSHGTSGYHPTKNPWGKKYGVG